MGYECAFDFRARVVACLFGRARVQHMGDREKSSHHHALDYDDIDGWYSVVRDYFAGYAQKNKGRLLFSKPRVAFFAMDFDAAHDYCFWFNPRA